MSIFHSQNIASYFAYKVEIYYQFKMLQDKYYEAEKSCFIVNEPAFSQNNSCGQKPASASGIDAAHYPF
jgi:hypothetical protein